MGGQLFLFDHFLNKLTMRKELLLLPLILFCLELAAQGTEAYNKSRLLVKLKGAVPPEYFIADFSTHSRAGGGVWIGKKLSIEKNISLLLYDTAAISAEELMSELKGFPDVESVQYDYYLDTRNDPNDPDVLEQWGLYAIQANKAWGITTGGVSAQGDTIVVAVLDSGFDTQHEDIQENIWINRGETPGDGIDNDNNGYVDDVMGWNFITDSPIHKPEQHGHSVAGIIGAKGNNSKGVSGINWDVKLMVMEAKMVSHIIAAYEYIIEQRSRYNRTGGKAGAFIVATNASFGVNRIFCDQQPMWGEMYDRLGKAGVLTAAAAANNAWNIDEVGDMPTSCPSDFLLTVLNTNNADQRHPGSAYGKKSIDLGAPGQNSYTTKPFNRYGEFHGNSAAAPHLAGAIALLYSLPCGKIGTQALSEPDKTALRIRAALLDGADRLPVLADVCATGGRLNIFNSLNLLLEDCIDPATIGTRLNVYPNPTNHSVYLDFVTPAEQPSALRIFNTLGQCFYQRSYRSGKDEVQGLAIPVHTWKPGVYYVQLLRGNVVTTQKFQVVGN
jgi:hypothetical protein